jgi:glycine/D-amino acid oxidase-like deaminating enzyme
MPTLYADTAVSAAATPILEDDVRTDVIVIGGGFTGMSTALHLAEKGAKVVLLEAESPGWGASGRNGGQVNPGLKHDPDTVEADFGTDLGGRMNALAGAAPALVFDLVRRHGIDCDARRNGTLRAAVGARHAGFVRASVRQLQSRDAPVELLEGSALERATGTRRYTAALFDRRGGDLNPLHYARGLAQAAVRAGAAVFCDSTALTLEPAGAQWQVTPPAAAG